MDTWQNIGDIYRRKFEDDEQWVADLAASGIEAIEAWLTDREERS